MKTLLLALSLLFLTSCLGGSDGDLGSASSDLDPCALLTNAEVEAAIGVPVESKEDGGSQDGSKFCHWYGQDESLLQRGISLIVADDLGEERYDSFKELATSEVVVTGLGDAAFADAADHEGVTTYQGSAFLRLTALYTGSGVTQENCKSLASIALPRVK